MFDKILIANRGEIACRVATTARRMGIRTVAVYSDADAGARHVALCDEAWRIGPAPARGSYLRTDEILRVARATGAQAIHPGYGFLSENEDFALACEAAGIVFIGPPANAIRAMGLKAESKRLMAEAGVPLVPGYHDADQNPEVLRAAADRIGYPVLIKASAGGGGKGMRIVERAADFDAALASCRREAAASFGNDAVLVERYLSRPRHIEIQVFADAHGNCLSLFERDCSVQRRHQKVIEEAPAPGMTAERRAAMGAAATAAARAVGYRGAGTVEFIAEPDGRFYFMEMNTRLQVEHPVTEMITGLDLVEWQLRVAAGEPLPSATTAASAAAAPTGDSTTQPGIDGHAIEVRIYAENPEAGFLPSIGRLDHLEEPDAVQFTVRGADGRKAAVRIDAGVREGDTITPFYDPMIAKLIVWGEDRETARRRLAQALAQLRIVGPATNIDFLRRLVDDQAFVEADLDTGLIERRRAQVLPVARPSSAVELALAAAALASPSASRPRSPETASPWSTQDGWRIGRPATRTLRFEDGEAVREVQIDTAAHGTTLTVDDMTVQVDGSSRPGFQGLCLADGARVRARVIIDGETVHVFGPDGHRRLTVHDPITHPTEGEDAAGQLTAPMPGKVIAIHVRAGDRVSRGDPLLVMEAMKMEHTINAPQDGVIAEVRYAVGDQVAEGDALVAVEVG